MVGGGPAAQMEVVVGEEDPVSIPQSVPGLRVWATSIFQIGPCVGSVNNDPRNVPKSLWLGRYAKLGKKSKQVKHKAAGDAHGGACTGHKLSSVTQLWHLTRVDCLIRPNATITA